MKKIIIITLALIGIIIFVNKVVKNDKIKIENSFNKESPYKIQNNEENSIMLSEEDIYATADELMTQKIFNISGKNEEGTCKEYYSNTYFLYLPARCLKYFN